jgi:hypothetical protein
MSLSGHNFKKLLKELMQDKRMGTSMAGARWPGYQACASF